MSRSAPPTRRSFLVQGGCGLVTLASLGLPREAAALPLSYGDGQASGNERRYPIPAGDGVTIDRQAQVILVRYAGRVYAMALACPHEHAAVRWVARDGRFQCTKHDSRYTPDGLYTSGRATRNLDRFPIRRDGQAVLVGVDRVFRSDREGDGWKTAVVDVAER